MLGRAARRFRIDQIGGRPGAKGLGQVLDDGAGLGHHGAAISHHGRLAQRMDVLEFGRRQPARGGATVKAGFIGYAQLLQQPKDALGARHFKVVDGDQGAASLLADAALRSQRISVPSSGSFSYSSPAASQ